MTQPQQAYGSVVLLVAAVCAAPAWAQSSPAWSRGLQTLSIRVSECSARAQAALQAEGYNVTNRSNPSEDAFFAGGQKSPHSAVIMCDRNADGRTWVNIVVATNGGDGGGPGLERQRLQGRMDNAAPMPPSPTPPPGPGPNPVPRGPAKPIDWSTDAHDFRDHIGERFTVQLPPGGTAKGCWGTDIYTDDSSIGTAAVHFGLITFERGGTVVVEMRPGLKLPGYTGSTRNGVESRRWDGAPASFVFVTSNGTDDVIGVPSGGRAANPLEGNWVGTSGEGGLREEWQITNNNGQWSVRGQWFRGNVEAGTFRGTDYRYQNGRLLFTQVIDRAPIDGWTSGTKIDASASGDSLTFRWTTDSGSGGVVTQRRKQN